METGTVFDIQHFSIHDGPGIRTTVFLKGCPLRCQWCHNPESYQREPQILFDPGQCAGCGACAAACEQGCHSLQAGTHDFDRSACVRCGACARACLFGSLTVAGRRATVAELMEQILADRFFYESSGGGLTLSGGEPMYQPEFALALAAAAKAEGLHVCMETSGFCPWEKLQPMTEVVDLFLFDYKVTDPALHRQWTGVDNGPILENLTRLDRCGAKTILRCPLIPGVNLTEDHARGIARTAAELENLQEIHLEPYHNAGLSKRDRLGMEQTRGHIQPPERAALEQFAARIRQDVPAEVKIL